MRYTSGYHHRYHHSHRSHFRNALPTVSLPSFSVHQRRSAHAGGRLHLPHFHMGMPTFSFGDPITRQQKKLIAAKTLPVPADANLSGDDVQCSVCLLEFEPSERAKKGCVVRGECQVREILIWKEFQSVESYREIVLGIYINSLYPHISIDNSLVNTQLWIWVKIRRVLLLYAQI